jgi:hypothetical protein
MTWPPEVLRLERRVARLEVTLFEQQAQRRQEAADLRQRLNLTLAELERAKTAALVAERGLAAVRTNAKGARHSDAYALALARADRQRQRERPCAAAGGDR